MIKLCIILSGSEITLALRHPPKIFKTFDTFRENDISFHEDDVDGVYDFLKFIDWSKVQAVLQYPMEEPKKEAAGNGQETG